MSNSKNQRFTFVYVAENTKLEQIKTGPFNQNIELSRQVEPPRIELGSKQATKELSTRLVSD